MKTQTVIRLDKDLLETAKAEAKAQKSSLSNYIENLLYRELGNIPNEETQQAIYGAHNDINLTRIEDIDIWLESLLRGDFDG